MLFNSFAYAAFLPIVFAVYWLLKERYRWILLAVASYFFYLCSGPKYGLIIFSITCISYVSARLIENVSPANKKNILAVSVIACVGVLFFFKYFNFFSQTVSDALSLMGIRRDPVLLHIVLPVGISFYTFQAVSYVIDVYKGTTSAEHHFGKYVVFISFFPQLVAGPIERSGHLMSQIKKAHRFDYEQAMYGVKLMGWGYYKKLVIADVLSAYVQTVYHDPHGYTGFALILATVFFSLQIYCDFSGYSDIAVGTAKLFDISLMTNFKSPYFSLSIKEFWSRWHISLSTWFRDYIYIPLGGNRVGRMRHYCNLMITFLLSGFWHGSDWTFMAWGGIHGLAQVVENAIYFGGGHKASGGIVRKAVRAGIVFMFCSFAWIFFVSDSIADAFYVIGNCLTGMSDPLSYFRDGFSNIGVDGGTLVVIGLSVFVMAVYDYISLKEDFVGWIAGRNIIVRWGFYIVIGLFIVFLSKKGVAAEFIYFQF